jgi:hypothetical protein
MVSARHGIGAGIVITSAVVIGCASKAARLQAPSTPPSAAARTHPSPTDEGRSKDEGTAAANTSDAPPTEVAPRSVAQHTEAYARNLESMLSRRGAAPADDPDEVSTIPPLARDPFEAEDTAAGDTTPAGTTANTGMRLDAKAGHGGQDVAPQRPALADARGSGAARDAQRGVRSDADPQSPSWDTLTSNAPARGADQPATAPAAEAEAAGARSFAAPTAAGLSEELVRKISARMKQDPRDAAAHLDYQLLQFLLDEPVPQLSAISSLPAEDRELLTTLLDGLSNFRNGLRAEANMLHSKKVAPLLELADRLRAQADLTLPAALLCKSVTRFGVYEPMDPPRFVSGKKENNAIIYCEVANFASQMTPNKMWETKLKQEAVLYSETGLAVWSDKSDTVTDLSRNRLHDFFIADKIRIPGNLPIGRYLLKMTVTDLHANRVAEATVPVQIVAQ